MRIFKRLIIIFVLLFSVITLSGCDLFGGDDNGDDHNNNPEEKLELALEDESLSWNAITNASKYIIKIDGNEIETTTNSFNLGCLYLVDGDYTIKVEAFVNGAIVTFDDSVTLDVNRETEKDSIYSELLKLYDETYVPDMNESDFEFDYDYEEYLSFSTMAQTLSLAAARSNLTSSEVKDIYEKLSELTGEFENFDDLKEYFDSFEAYELSTQALSNIAYDVALIMVDLYGDSLENDIEFYEEEIKSYEDQINAHKNDPSIEAIHTEIKEYATLEQFNIIEDAINGNYYYEYLYYIDYIINEACNEIVVGSFDYDNFIIAVDDELALALLSTLNQSVIAEDEVLLNYFYYNSVFDFFKTIDYYETIARYNSYIEEINNQIDIFNEYKTKLSSSKDVFIPALNVVLNYFINVYGELDNELFEMVEEVFTSQVFSPEEVFILKDEIVSLFENTLPSQSDFVKVFELVDIFDNEDYITEDVLNYLSTGSYIQANLMIDLLKEIDLEMYNDVFEIMSEMGMDQYEDARIIVRLVVYAGKFFNKFVEDHNTEFESLSALQTEEVQNMFMELYMQFLGYNINDTYSNMYDYINDFLVGIDDVLVRIGTDVYDEFLETDGQIAIAFIDFIEAGYTYDDPYLAETEIKNIFNELLKYHSLTIASLTETEVDTLVTELVDLTAAVILVQNDINETELVSDFLEDIAPTIGDVVYNILQVEKALIEELDNNDAIDELFNHEVSISFDLSALEQFVKALDEALTEERLDLIYNSIDLISTNIFGHEDFQEISGAEQEDIDNFVEDTELMIIDIVDLVDQVATFNFDNLTEDQTAIIDELLYYFQ